MLYSCALGVMKKPLKNRNLKVISYTPLNLEKAVAAKFTPLIVELKAAKNLTLFFDLKTSEAERKKRVDAL